MIKNISKRAFAIFVKEKEVSARKDELQALRPYIPSKIYNKRLNIFLDKLEELQSLKTSKKVEKSSKKDVVRIVLSV